MRSEDNELLTRVGPGTPMGEFMRQYWFPVCASAELEPGGVPVRLKVLGEDFLGFRSPDGKVGVIDHQCAHRCASLFYGRNEEGGIRCVYHGWKFDQTGQCIEMPSEPPETDYKQGVKLRAAQVREAWGAVWVYLGTAEAPPLPNFEFEKVPEGDLSITFLMRECNWLQALEGDIDTCHVGFLHGGSTKSEDHEEGSHDWYMNLPENRHPKYEAMETPYGSTYTAYRQFGPENTNHRVGHYLLPFWTMAPSEPIGHIRARAWVPMDDHHSMLVVISGPRPRFAPKHKDGRPMWGMTVEYDYLPNTTDWFGRWRIRENPRNDHLIAREMQRDGNYTGVVGIAVQDQMITESMGPIEDRTKEHLGTSDKMIALTRRVMIKAVTAFRDNKQMPAGYRDPATYAHMRAGHFTIDSRVDWLDEFNRYRGQWSGGAASPMPAPPGRRRPAPVRQDA
jgi:phthalate 4,5-dioxygenase oxygenase subunit